MKARFASEAEMCERFIAEIPKTWLAYRETGGWDILLVHKPTGTQIGIEAKLSLNAEVLRQAIPERWSHWSALQEGPDFRAVLVPAGCSTGLAPTCRFMGVAVIHMTDDVKRRYSGFTHCYQPPLPDDGCLNRGDEPYGDWADWWPARRVRLPEYVPADIRAGASAPVKLTEWKIAAIKILITLEKRGFVTPADFRHHRISIARWVQPPGWAWLAKGQAKGQWVRGDRTPDYKREHPTNYAEIEADYEKWKTPNADSR